MKRGWLYPLAALSCVPQFLPAQTPASNHVSPGDAPSVTRAITGSVSDSSGAILPGATVHVESRVTQAEAIADTVADAGGRFTLQLVPGTYKVFITAPGFQPFVRDTFVVGSKNLKPLAVTLRIADANEIVNVSGEDATGSAANNGGALVFKGKQLDTLSDNDSTLQQQLNAISGGGDDSGGGTPHMYVDGFSNGRFPPKSSIREIRINQNPFSAQYDDYGFGRIEIFTKPGSDTYHGDLRLNGNSNAFNAPNPFQRNQPGYHTFYLDGDVSGPIGKKSSFFFSSNYYDGAGNAIVNATTVDPTTLAVVPLNTAIPNPVTNHDYTARFDRQLTTNNTFTGRYEYNIAYTTNAGVGQLALPSQATDNTTTTQTLQLGNTQIIGAHRTNETRFQYIRTRVDQTATSSAPTVVVSGNFNGGGAPAQNFTDNQDRYEFQDYFGWDHGSHYIRLGARYGILRDSNFSQANYNGQYTFPDLNSYAATLNGIAAGLSPAAIRAAGGGASQFTITEGQPSAVILTGDLGLYADDEWKVRKNLTLNYGLRYETQSAVYDHNDPAPRAGFAWQVHQGDKKPAWFVLRGGAGIFYSRIDSSSLLTTVRQNGVSQVSYILDQPDSYPNLPDLGTQPSVQPTIYRLDPHERTPYEFVGNISAERSLGKLGRVTVTYMNSRGVHQLTSINANAPLPGTYDPAVPGSGVKPLGDQNIDQFTTGAVFRGNRIMTNWFLQPAKWITTWGFYGHAIVNADGGGGFASDSYDIHADYGRSSWNIHNRLFTGANVTGPWGFSLDLFLAATGGRAFNITTGADNNGDTIYNDRPAFATDLTRASVVKTSLGNFDTNPMAGQQIVPYNYGNGPAFVSLQTRLEKTFKFGPIPAAAAEAAADPSVPVIGGAAPGKAPKADPKYQLSLAAEAQNVTNHLNGGIPVGVLSSPNFGKYIDIANFFSSNTAANRSIDLALSFRF